MRSGVPGQIAGMKPNASDNPEEIRHGSAHERRIGRPRVLANIDIRLDNRSVSNISPINARPVIDVLLDDSITSGGSIVTLAPGGNRSGQQHFSAFRKVGVLIG